MKYLVTGGAGFVGSHLTEYLIKQGHEVTVIDDYTYGSIKNIPDEIRKDVTILERSVSKEIPDIGNIDGIFHLACHHRIDSITNPLLDIEINAKGTINSLVYAKKHNAKLLFTSNSGLVGDIPTNIDTVDETYPANPKTVYDADKLVSEYYCKIWNNTHNVDVVICRFSQIFGCRQFPKGDYKPLIVHFVRQMLRNKIPVIFGDGRQTRDLLYVKDAVKGITLAMSNKSTQFEKINISSNNEYSVNEIYSICAEKTGFNKKPSYMPERGGDVRRTRFSNRKAFELLGWKPDYSLGEAVDKVVEFEYSRLH